MSDFHEVLFPVDISYRSGGGPKWKTAVFTVDSGFEARISDWSSTRAEYDVSMGVRSAEQIEALTSFFMNRRGRAYGFRFKDWNDHTADNVVLGRGDYATTRFQIRKTYENVNSHNGATFTFDRPLKKIEWGSETGVKIDGLTITKSTQADRFYSLDYNTGMVTLNEPMRGALYAGQTPSTLVDMITVAEGGTSQLWVSPTLRPYTVTYQPNKAWAVLFANFANSSSVKGLRKIDVAQGKEVAQARASTIGGPFTDYSGIICVDRDGFIYVNAGGSSNGQPIVKVDGANLSYVTSWGAVNNALDVLTTSSYPGVPGCASLNGETFVHIGLFNDVTLHQTSNCAAIKKFFTAPGPTASVCPAAPYRENGYAIASRSEDPDNRCSLRICYPQVSFEAMTWGGPTSEVRAAYYDQKTGGVLLFWEGEDGDPNARTDAWAGLWHEDKGGFVWRRRMPNFLWHIGSNGSCSAYPLKGEMVWGYTATYFGSRVWRIDTETGEVSSRALAVTGDSQAYDPDRKVMLLFNNGSERIVNTDVQGVARAASEVLDMSHVEFHVGVRFDVDHLDIKHEFWTYRSWESIPLVEVRNWDDLEVD